MAGPNYTVIPNDWANLEYIISDLSSRIINEDTSFTDYLLADGSRTLTGDWSLGGFNLTEVGNITGSDIDISAGTGTYTSSGTITAGSLTASDLTETRVVFAGANGLLVDDAAFTFITDTLLSPNVTASGLITTPALLLNLGDPDDHEQYKFQRNSVGGLALSNIDPDGSATFFKLYPPEDAKGTLFQLHSNSTVGSRTNNVRLTLSQSPSQAMIFTDHSGTGFSGGPTPLTLQAGGNAGQLVLNTDGTIELNGGTVLFGGNLILPDGQFIGSVGEPEAIQIGSGGTVTFPENVEMDGNLDVTGTLTVSGSTDLGNSSADVTRINNLYDLPKITGTTGFLVYQTGTDTKWGYVDPASLSVALAAEVTVADESSDETCFPAFFTAATGDLAIKTDADGLTYNSLTKSLTISGGLTVNTTTLVVDSTNGLVGIGKVPMANVILDVLGADGVAALSLGQAISLRAGDGGPSAQFGPPGVHIGGVGGTIIRAPGAGADCSTGTSLSTGGEGGSSTDTTGGGGNATSSTGDNTGGRGGQSNNFPGKGGDATGTTAGDNLGGNGSTASSFAGAGGDAANGGTNTGGGGGDNIVSSGAKGTGATANGIDGSVFLQIARTTVIEIDGDKITHIGDPGTNETVIDSGGSITQAGTAVATLNLTTSSTQTEWDSAYDNMVEAIAFNTGDGIITITQQDSGTLLTDSLDGRYFTETELGSTSNGVGASLIGIEDDMLLYAGTNVEDALEEVMDQITIVTHVADSFEVGGDQVGTVTGIVENTQVINDGDELILNETTGGPNPNFVQTFEFSGITAGHEPNLIELHWYYSPTTSPHTISIQMYNYNTSTWDVIDNTTLTATGGTLTFSSITITDGGSPIVDYTSGGVARVRFSHDDNGVSSHDFGIDYLAIKDDHGIGSGITDHGSMSGLQDDDHNPLYHTDGRAATWLAANHETTFTHADIATNTTHGGLSNNPHTVTATQVGLGNVTDVATDDTAYDATSWDANADAATKNAIRDKIETMDTAIGLNTSKVTNANHTGEVTGSGALTAQPVMITGKDAATVASGDLVLVSDINDSNILKKVTAQSIGDLGGGGDNDKVGIDAGATPGFIGAASNDGVLRTSAPLAYADGGDFVTISITQSGAAADGYLDSTDWNTFNNKVDNVPTELSLGTVGINTVAITSDGGADDVTLPAATVAAAGMFTTAKWGEVVANTAKATNVSTALSTGTVDGTSYGITSDGGVDDVVIAQADTDFAGVLSAVKWDEIVANTLKDTNVTTNLSLGAITATTMIVESSDGTDATLIEADTNDAGLLGAAKWNEIVANSLHTADNSQAHTDYLINNGNDSTSGVLTAAGFTVGSMQLTDGVITDATGLSFVADTSITGDFAVNTNALIVDSATDRVSIGTASSDAQLHIDNVSGSHPVLLLNQGNELEDMIEFLCTIGVGRGIEAKGGKTLTTTHFVKVTLPAGLIRYIPVGTIA